MSYQLSEIADYFGKEILSHKNPYDYFEIDLESASARCLSKQSVFRVLELVNGALVILTFSSFFKLISISRNLVLSLLPERAPFSVKSTSFAIRSQAVPPEVMSSRESRNSWASRLFTDESQFMDGTDSPARVTNRVCWIALSRLAL